jgi:hypothetical protein
MRYSNIIEFEHKTVVPPPFNLIEFIVRIGLIIYIKIYIKLLKKDTLLVITENTNFVLKEFESDEQEEDLNKFEKMIRDEYLTIEENLKTREE